MYAFGGGEGYDYHGQAQQQEHARDQKFEYGYGSRPSAPPSLLSKALYIQEHDNTAMNLQLYDVSAEYKRVVGQSPMGGEANVDAIMGTRLYMIRLGTFRTANAYENKKLYDVQTRVDGDGASVVVSSGDGAEDGGICKAILTNDSNDFKIAGGTDTKVSASFPIAATVSNAGITRHPYFTHTSPEDGHRWEWRINPMEDGPLRYTLVETNRTMGAETVKAIYHHIGKSPTLSMPTSQGILLLPENKGASSESEIFTVTSFFGMLWRVRGLGIEVPVHDVSKDKKKSLFKRVFK